MIAGCSSGIEPLYGLSYTKHVLEGEGLKEIHPHFLKLAKEQGLLNERLEDHLSHFASIQGFASVPNDLRRVFVTAHDISPEEQVILQALFQKQVDNAVSKTINLKEAASPSEVRNIFLLAYQQKCKGITVYREGSKPGQVLTPQKSSECPFCGRHLRAKEGGLECEMCG
jgi:ribonucleoside-diphosphate reductase alpha chain